MSFFRGFASKGADTEVGVRSNDGGPQEVLKEGSLEFTVAQANNGSAPAYQEASGAPVETSSPFGYSVGPVTILFLNISMMVGTGVYSTPSSILKGTGSVGLSLIYWPIGFLIAISSLAVYLEYAANFPNRSGSEVVYLEQAYPRPKYFFPIAFAVQTVILSFSSGNSIVLATYLFRTNGHTPTHWELKGVAVAGYTVAVLLLIFHTRFAYWLSNAIGIIKVSTLIFVAITGFVVLGGHTRVEDPKANFRNAFEGTTHSGYGVTNALVKIIFSYAGYTNAFNVVNEVKNPVKAIRKNASVALLIVAILYQLANIAYFAAIPKAELEASTQVVAGLFFQKVFGTGRGVKGLNILIAFSAFGNLIAVLLGQSRLIRECGRQGVLPFPNFWASTRPFGTPLGPFFIKWLMTILMILAPPAGDAFNFIVDLQSYPSAVFNLAMAAGLYLVRYRRRKLGVGRPEFRAWDVVVIFNIASNLFLVIMPWYPPATGRYGGDVSFWYATYVVVGISIIVLCGIYYWAWIYFLPKLGHYQIRQEVLFLDSGATTHKLVKVPNEKLAAWDSTHDVSGRPIATSGPAESEGSAEYVKE